MSRHILTAVWAFKLPPVLSAAPIFALWCLSRIVKKNTLMSMEHRIGTGRRQKKGLGWSRLG